MTPWIKICGLTRADAVAAALAARIDAIGFVFTSSPRRLSPSAAAALAAPARGRLACVAVARRPSQPLIDEILSVFKPDLLQLDMEDLPSLSLPSGCAVLPVLRSGHAEPDRLPARLLYEGAVSGAGARCDWQGARAVAARTELVLAGGLNAAHIGEALRAVRPFGLDVSSGVEIEPGIKSPERMQEFVIAARTAFATLKAGAQTAGEDSIMNEASPT